MDDYSLDELVFSRTDYGRVYFKDKYLVTGHTPTRLIYSIEAMEPSKYKDEIFLKNNHIAIDCGCGYSGRLGSISLETMKCYYV